MSMVINTNMGSENAIRLLDKTTRSQSTSMERLTSGQAINHAKDNASGLAVVTGMTAQIRGTDMAVKNANDGIGLIQTMDGASEEVVNMLQRQRELSIQSLNGTYNNANRAQMNTEFQQLTKEINRVGTTTKFNQVDLMAHMSANGSVLSTKASATELQIGWQVAGMTGSRNKLGVSRFNFTTQFSGSLANGNIFGTFTFVSANGSKILSAKGTSYGAQGISTQASASVAVMRIDSALSNIGTVRAKWGAMQNRLEYTVSNLQNVNENIQAARSRIQDTDYARESANLARTQVLQQAGMSMLSQSNQMSQNVMSLLK
jgi:flagellin